MSSPVIVQIRPGKAALFGTFFAVFALFCASIAVLGLRAGAENAFPLGLSFFGAAGFGLMGIFMLGVAVKKPVALRMDQHGVSGFYTAPLTWGEITKIEVYRPSKGHPSLAFTLMNPDTVRPRLSLLQRINTGLNGTFSGHHIAIPGNLLKVNDLDALAHRARVLHVAALT